MALLRWMWRYFRHEIIVLPTRTMALLFAIFLLAVPLFTRNSYTLRVLIVACIFAVYAASWDLLSGYAGQISFGHALFFGVAAYTTAILNLRLGWSPFITIPLGALAAVASGAIAGIPALRLKGPYLGLATLSFPIILTGLVFVFSSFTGGELGLSGLSRLFANRVHLYYGVLIVSAALIVALWQIAGSRLGLILHAIREDEIAVRAAGLNTTYYKLLAFSVSGFFAGIAGGLYAHMMRVAGPGTLDLLTSFTPIIFTIFGGIVTIYGPVVGTFILYPLLEFLHVVPELRALSFALVLIAVLRFMPRGLGHWVRDWLERECPRCKARNALTRPACRVCGADLRRPAPGAKADGRAEVTHIT